MTLLARHSRSHVVVLLTLAALAIGGMLADASARAAAFPDDLGAMRPIRIEGYWGRDRRAPKVLDSVTFVSSDGGPRRIFGITRLQAYKPEEEGPQVLRHSGLQPAIRVIGPPDLVHRFMNAPDGAKVVATGVYRAGSGMLTLTSAEVED